MGVIKHQTVTKKNIRNMVDRFYSKVLKDELLADFFIEKLGDEMITEQWQNHLTLLTSFWASIILNDTSYKGQPIKPHMHMQGLNKETFKRWLKLFFETVDGVYVKETADIFKTNSESIAKNFIKLLKL